MKNLTTSSITLIVSLTMLAGCLETQPQSEDEEIAEATASAQQMNIDSNAIRANEDALEGQWNLRLDGLQAWYAGGEMISLVGGSGSVDAGDFLDALCEERGFCMTATIAIEFEQGESRSRMTRYSMYPEDEAGGLDGILVHRLGVAVFHVGADYIVHDGYAVDAVAGYASQLGITPSRPEIDVNFSGSHDGVILLEVGGGASIANMIVPAGGAIIAVPFDAVSCDQFPPDCVR